MRKEATVHGLAEAVTPAAQQRTAGFAQTWMERIRPYLYVTPAMIFFTLFFFFPIAYVIYLSFFDWSLLNLDEIELVGLENYTELLGDSDFYQVLGNSFVYTVCTVGLGIVLSFFLALWLNQKAKVYGVIQAAVFSPHIISLVSVSMLWMWLMDTQYGLLNAILEMVGLPGYTWLAQPGSAMVSLILVSIWKGLGYNTLVFIAGLQSIPRDIYEAAQLDHSPWWRTLTRITVPMLSPTLFFLLVINTVSSFQVFDTIYIMTQGGPINSTNMLVFYIYEQGIDFYNGGAASAASVILLAVVGILTFLHFRVMGKRVHYQ
ncbi:carbohydrate ABC transporter permease [Brevibacillus sp. TJ4]|uniref:carbohydrate ABC transporter permease n=1 Tax=Brevibacillus sp. TJ4 TaxID=3234853 RepID=UPI0037DC6BF9